MCAEKVLRLVDRLFCRRCRRTPNGRRAAAIRRPPECAGAGLRHQGEQPRGLERNRLPPVFGPVIGRQLAGGITLTVTGTAAHQRMARRLQLEGTARQGRLGSPSIDAETARAPAARRAGCVSDRPRQLARTRAGTHRPTPAESVHLPSSCSRSATMSLLISTVLSGSRNRLAPLVDAPCTMPGIDVRCSALTTST